MRKIIVFCLAALALFGAAGAGALAKALLVAKRGDVVLVQGTDILCTAQARSNFTCFKTKDGKTPVTKSYGVGISPRGVTVGHFGAAGKPVKIVFERHHGK